MRSPQLALLRSALGQLGATVRDEGESLVVSGMEIADIGELAAAKGVVLHELSPQRGSLEEAFIQLTGDSVEYHAAADNAEGQSPCRPQTSCQLGSEPMTLLAVERIKLFTTRSPLWCTIAALFVTVGFAALIAGVDTENLPDIASTQFGYSFGLVVVMVMATLASPPSTASARSARPSRRSRTGPPRCSPRPPSSRCSPASSVSLASFASVGIAKLIQPSADLAVNTAFEWRAVAGVGLVYAAAAIMAVSVGTLVRHSAGAVSLILSGRSWSRAWSR